MQRLLLAAAPICVIVLTGCAVYTPGTQGLPSASVAELTAGSEVGGRNYDGYAVTAIQIDGRSYPLKEDKTTFVLTAGRHDVAFSYSMMPPGPAGKAARYFDALPGGRYELGSDYQSAGLGHQIQTSDHNNVLKWEAADKN